MIWEVEIRSRHGDAERDRIAAEIDLVTPGTDGIAVIASTSRGYLLEGDLTSERASRLANDLLHDSVVESVTVSQLSEMSNAECATVLLKPGVMDPAAMSVLDAARDLGFQLKSVARFRRYYFGPTFDRTTKDLLFRRILANDAIEDVILGQPRIEHLAVGREYDFRLVHVALLELDESKLEKLSRDGQLALSLDEMKAIQVHFRELGREPTDIELETIAQTWSEHCSHKTLKGRIECDNGHVYQNLLKETIFAATQSIRDQLGVDDWCVSVFEDNAGIVRFDERIHVCFKVETHNRPSAIEPYGGANTGIGGVIRDVLGCGLGAKPIANTDVFCFAPPETPVDSLPPGVLHPLKVMRGVVAGVRDYGNRTGIPTVNGAVVFDPRYLGNPLVFCGTVGIIPIDKAVKKPLPGDYIVSIGGRTGRDGIHGATFSSAGLSSQSDEISGGAVQIGNAITEKKLLDVLLQARDRGLYHAVTDCGAGGFSSAIGEMGADIGAIVHLDRAPLKYQGLSYTEIWISEAQERMILAVPPKSWQEFKRLCESENVEATSLGQFEATGQLKLLFNDHLVGQLSMTFLHDGRPKKVLRAQLPATPSRKSAPRSESFKSQGDNWATDALKKILAAPSVCSKEVIIRQYDHEVQGCNVLKPLVGIGEDGPGDAAVITPVLGTQKGLAIACGINPRYGDLDPYAMAACAIDEAVRNLVAVGADPSYIALLDNFCWGNTNDPAKLGALVRACESCRDVAMAWRMPFISGKDSLHNEFHSANRHIAIPGTLLISAIGRVPDIRRCVSMDFKSPGNLIYLIGKTSDELGGSHFNLVTGRADGIPPTVDLGMARRLFHALHSVIKSGLVRSCHDLSEGGLAVAAAEMAFAGGVGADLSVASEFTDDVTLFSESQTRWLVEVSADKLSEFEAHFTQLPLLKVGQTVRDSRLRIAGGDGQWLVWATLAELKSAWQKALGLQRSLRSA